MKLTDLNQEEFGEFLDLMKNVSSLIKENKALIQERDQLTLKMIQLKTDKQILRNALHRASNFISNWSGEHNAVDCAQMVKELGEIERRTL